MHQAKLYNHSARIDDDVCVLDMVLAHYLSLETAVTFHNSNRALIIIGGESNMLKENGERIFFFFWWYHWDTGSYHSDPGASVPVKLNLSLSDNFMLLWQ